MKIPAVSFGKVVAVSGKPSRIKSLNACLKPFIEKERVKVIDITDNYINASSDGKMAKAAQKGNTIEAVISGKDVRRFKNKVPGWETLDRALSHLSEYYDINKIPKSTIMNTIYKSQEIVL